MDPEEIENRQFIVTLRGYARDEVDSFREEVAQEIKILRKQLTKATSELSHSNAELAKSRTQLGDLNVQLDEVNARLAVAEQPREEPEPATRPEPPKTTQAEDRASAFKLVGQETERILLAAEQAAEQLHERAMKESAEIMTDARLKAQRTMEELAAARRAAEEDFAGIKESRNMVASQLEDIRRRLEETISRLRVPVELPGPKTVSRFRQRPEGSEKDQQQPGRMPESSGWQLQNREQEAAVELQSRQNAHRAEVERRENELRSVQAEARKAQQAADMQAAVTAAREADRLKAERSRSAEEAARAKAEEAARAKGQEAARARAEEAARAKAEEAARVKAEVAARVKAEVAARAKAEEAARAKAEEAARAKAEAVERAKAEEAARAKAEEAARARAEEAASAKAEEAARAKAEKAARAESARPEAEAARPEAGQDQTSAKKPKNGGTEKPKDQDPAPEGGSSLDDLLAEIRRKREEEERQANPQPQLTPSVTSNEQILRRREALGDLPAQTARRLKRLLQEEHNDLLDRMRVQKGKGTADDNLAPKDEQLNRFAAGLGEALDQAFSEGRKVGGAGGGADSSAVVARLLSRQVLNPLRTEVLKAIASGLEVAESAPALSERANDVFRVWKGVRTQLLGEGISYAAYHQGLVDAWGAESGANKSWILSEEESECPGDVCRKNADAGPVSLKTPFPSGHLAPPAHGGCTCTLGSA